MSKPPPEIRLAATFAFAGVACAVGSFYLAANASTAQNIGLQVWCSAASFLTFLSSIGAFATAVTLVLP
jgi:hypothetical protein